MKKAELALEREESVRILKKEAKVRKKIAQMSEVV